MSLSGCTVAMWGAPLQLEATQTTMRAARANDARLQRTPDGDTLHVWLDVDGHPPCAFALQPQGAFVERFTEAVNGEPHAQLTLRVVHRFSAAPEHHEWEVHLDTAPTTEPRATRVVFRVSSVSTDPPRTTGVPLTLHTVEWTEIETTTTTDTLGIAWRVAATPFTVAADIVLVIPIAIVGGIILLFDPGLMTGG